MYKYLLLIFTSIVLNKCQTIIDIIAPKLKNSKLTSISYTENLIERNGFLYEKYEIITDDRYILKLYRIINSDRKEIQNKSVVIFGHGLFASSDCWLTRGRYEDLAFILADTDYDVWLLNYRGNIYSKKHEYLLPNDSKFWDFSFHEMGLYDLPNSIDLILKITQQKSVMYIGHSMGTTIGYVTCSMRPEYNAKIHLMISFGPVIIFKHRLTFLQQILLKFYPYFANMLMFDQRYELMPYHFIYDSLAKVFCSNFSPTFPICRFMYFSFCGPNYPLFNSSLFSVIFKYYPTGNSIHTVNHYYNNLIHYEFLQRDLGHKRNSIIYQQSKPPKYPLKKVTTNVSLYYGATDHLSTLEDVQYLASFLPNLVLLAKVNYSTFNHGDFLYGIKANDILYKDVIKFMNQFR